MNYTCVHSPHLGIGFELCKCDPPKFGLGVDVKTGVLLPDLTGVCETESPTVGMGLHSVILNSHVCPDHLYFIS